jgi:hypothetical protein
VRANFADLTLWEVKLRVPSERAAASVLDVDADVEGLSGTEGGGGTGPVEIDDTLCEAPCRGAFCLLN